jgi:hypothetical protein
MRPNYESNVSVMHGKKFTTRFWKGFSVASFYIVVISSIILVMYFKGDFFRQHENYKKLN